MATDNRRAEGRRPPHRGRSDRESNPEQREIRSEKTIPLAQGLSNREAHAWQRRRERPHLQPPDTQD
jgi:hypothetical protein